MKVAEPAVARDVESSHVTSIVILGSSVTALGLVREAHALGLAPVLLDTRPGIAMGSRYPGRVILDRHEEAAIAAEVAELGRKQHALIATEDRWLKFIAAHRPRLELAYGVVVAPSNEALGICLNKAAFARWCAETSLPAPRSWSLDDIASASLPALMRPVDTLHDRPDMGLPKAVFVESLNSLHQWARRFRASDVEALVSESLLGRKLGQYSIPFARRDGATNSFVALKIRPPASWARNGTYFELCPNPDVEQLARTAVEALDYFGIGEVEVLQCEEDQQCYLVEINARPWLQYSLASASGHDFLAFALGLPSSGTPPSPKKKGVRWMSARADLYVCFSRSEGLVPSGKLRVREYLKSLLTSNAFAYFDLRDPWPAIKDFASLVKQAVCALMGRLVTGKADVEKRA